MYTIDFTSLHEPKALYKNRKKSGFVFLSKPSAILLIEIAARQIISLKPKSFEFFKIEYISTAQS